MNVVNLIGRLTNDLELKENMNGVKYVNFTVACNRPKRADEEEKADFIKCSAFGKTAEILAEYKKKGDQIGITGSIATGSYLKEDGTKVYTTNVVVNNLYFI